MFLAMEQMSNFDWFEEDYGMSEVVSSTYDDAW